MKNLPIVFAATAMVIAPLAPAQTVHSGLDYIFDLEWFQDITLEENQDRITDNVWITRDTSQGIFNIAQESGYEGSGSTGPSPIGTLWAWGTTAEYDTLTYDTWGVLHGGSPFSLLNNNVVVYLEDDDTYIDLMFTSWGSSGGGAFSYQRSIVPTPASTSLLALTGLFASRRRRS